MKRLGDLMGATLGHKEVLRAARAQTVSRQWADIVGSLLASKSTPDRFESGVLFIQAINSTWAQEIRMQEETIVERLNEKAQEPGLFREIRVSTGPTKRELME